MISTKFLSVLTAGLAGGVILLTVSPKLSTATRNAGDAQPAASYASGVAAPQIDQHALDTFRKLIPQPGAASSEAVIPTFNVKWIGWYTKCDVGLANCRKTGPGMTLQETCHLGDPQRPSGGQMGSSTNAKQLLIDALLKGLERPVQANGGKRSVSGGNRDKTIPQQAFATVLYNHEAACSLLKLAAGKPMYTALAAMQDNHQSEVDAALIEDGAIAVKVIWEPPSPTAKNTPTIGVVPGGDLYALPPEDLEDSLVNGSLPEIPRWLNTGHAALIDFSSIDGKCDAPTGSAPNLVYSASCFSYIPLADYKDSPAVNQVISPVAEVMMKHDPPYIVLVGVNVMEFSRSLYPHWLWSSFWWAQQEGKYFDGLPQWKHFQACSVHDVPATPIGQERCFNPYLEGVAQSPNGLVSNCLTCHQYAGFRKMDKCDSTGTLPVHTQEGICLGAPDKDGNPPPGCSVKSGDYAKATLLTHFLWSVGDASPPNFPASLDASCPQAQ